MKYMVAFICTLLLDALIYRGPLLNVPEAFSSQRHEATSTSTVPSGYKGIETKAYVAVASKAERCFHVAS